MGKFNYGIAEAFVPKWASPVHGAIIPLGNLGFNKLHYAGYGGSIFDGSDDYVKVIIYDGVGDQLEAVFFLCHGNDADKQVFDFL
jgi:hypothetical protein